MLARPSLVVWCLSLSAARAQGSGEAVLGVAGTFRKSYTSFATALRADLLTNGYDPMVPPPSDRSPAQPYNTSSGTDVNVQIRFFKVESIDAAAGAMRLKIWMRMNWVDQRLSWNPDDYGGIEQVWLNQQHGEPLVEHWAPDITPYNTREGLDKTLDAAQALVYSDGSVFWSRPGILDIMCKFSGLANFPFDDLTCGIDVGGWITGGGHQGITLMGGGYAFSSQEATAGTSFQEYAITEVTAQVHLYTYACCPSDPYPVIDYQITLSRAFNYYMMPFIIASIIITVLSFGVFFMSFEVGERLGYGMTLILTIQTTKVVVNTFVPVCGEALWMDNFLLINEYFALFALFESCVVLFLAFHTDNSIIPAMCRPPYFVLCQFAWLLGMPIPTKKLRNSSASSVASELVNTFRNVHATATTFNSPSQTSSATPPPSPPQNGDPNEADSEAELYPVEHSATDAPADSAKSGDASDSRSQRSTSSRRGRSRESRDAPAGERSASTGRPGARRTSSSSSGVARKGEDSSAASVMFDASAFTAAVVNSLESHFKSASPKPSSAKFYAPSDAPASSVPFVPFDGSNGREGSGLNILTGYNFDKIKLVRPLTPADHHKFVFFEKLFFIIDSDSNGYVLLEEMERLLSFLAVEIGNNERIALIKLLDDEGDQLVQQDEFVQACILLLWNVPQSQITWAAENYIEAYTTKIDRNLHYWRRCAKQLDKLARVWIVTAYIVSMFWIFSMVGRMNDPYHATYDGVELETETGMYQGIFDFHIHEIFLIGPAIAVLILSAYAWQIRITHRQKKKKQAQLTEMMEKVKSPGGKPWQRSSTRSIDADHVGKVA